jgi:hypothetical protein
MHLAAQRRESTQAMRDMLAAQGIDPMALNESGLTAAELSLITCVSLGLVSAAADLIALGTRVDMRIDGVYGSSSHARGGTLLHVALMIFEPSLPMHELLLTSGVDPDALDDFGRKSVDIGLQAFIETDDIDGVATTLALGANTDLRLPQSEGGTALHFAMSQPCGKNPDLYDLMLRFGFDPKATDVLGRTALEASPLNEPWIAQRIEREAIDLASRPAQGSTPAPRL